MKTTIAICLFGISSVCAAEQENPKEKDPISDYLVDITGGAVSAAGLVGLDKTAITQIQTAQDFAVAIQPFTQNNQKAGFGVAFTPARTKFFPVSGRDYYDSSYTRLFSNLTFGYAQTSKEIESKNYSQSGYSIDTYYYIDRDKDPAVIDSIVFRKCYDDSKDGNIKELDGIQGKIASGQLSMEEGVKQLDGITKKLDVVLRACQDARQDTKLLWNASRVSMSYGEGRIVRDASGDAFSLGKSLTVNAMLGVGTKGALNASLRRISNALDFDSLKLPVAIYRTSSLAGIRYTYGEQDDSSLRAIMEVSTAKSSAASVYKDVFMYAVGVDKKIYDGIWFEFRLGRNRSAENGKEQTAALMKVNILPSLLLPSKTKVKTTEK